MEQVVQPRAEGAARLCRRFMGLLMNAQEELVARGFPLADAYDFAVRAHLHWQALAEDAAPRARSDAGVDRPLELEFKRRILDAVDVLRQPPPPTCLADFQFAIQADPLFGGDAPDWKEDDSENGLITGLGWRRLRKFRDDLTGLNLPHPYVLPFGIFLGGMQRAVQAAADRRERDVWLGALDPNLVAAARQSLNDAVEFALQEEAQALSRSHSRIPGDTAYQCLFMGVAFAQSNHRFEVNVWLERGHYEENLLRLLLVMGILAWSDRAAHRLMGKYAAQLPALTADNFGRPLAEVIDQFAAQ